jgi:hypothetical protein
MMNRLIAIACSAVLLAVGMAGCGGSSANTGKVSAPEIKAPDETGETFVPEDKAPAPPASIGDEAADDSGDADTDDGDDGDDDADVGDDDDGGFDEDAIGDDGLDDPDDGDLDD